MKELGLNLDRLPTHPASHLVVYVGTYTHKEEEFFVFCKCNISLDKVIEVRTNGADVSFLPARS